MSALLTLDSLNAFYGPVQSLHGISLTLETGSVTALLGANGAGKTTTLRAITAMIRTSGEVRLDGKLLNGLSTEQIARLGVAHVPQGRGTLTQLTVEENLRLGAISRHDHGAITSDVARMFDLFPVLRERRTQKAGLLSGGEQQMLAVARALMLRPRLLLLDEPSFGLAPLIVRELFGVLAAVNREDGVTILIVEQNAGLALAMADRAHVIETGTIVTSGSAAEIARDEDIQKSYLGH